MKLDKLETLLKEPIPQEVEVRVTEGSKEDPIILVTAPSIDLDSDDEKQKEVRHKVN